MYKMLKLKDVRIGSRVLWRGRNKSMTVGRVYTIIDIEYPDEHFRGRIRVLTDDKSIKAYYCKYFDLIEY